MRLLFAVFVLFLGSAHAAPKSHLDAYWNTSGSASFDHSAWQSVLNRALRSDSSGVNRVDYASLRNDAELSGYLQSMASIDPRSLSRAEQFAYWVNYYNALTVDLIAKNYPVKSIRKIGGGLFGGGPWDDDIATVGGKTITLNDIEHRILRPIWNDPRIHYAVNCASIGCPNLQTSAFTASNTESLLQQSAIDYINHPRGVTVNGNRATASKIFDWYQVDFGNSEAGLKVHLLQYAKPELAAQLNGVNSWSYEYDWGLNE